MTGLVFAIALSISPPVEGMTDRDRAALGAALWGEAGVRAPSDWGPISWALARRRQRYPDRSFAWLVRHYSAPMMPRLASRSRMRAARATGDAREIRDIRHRRFFQALTWAGAFPATAYRRAFPGASVTTGRRVWDRIRAFVVLWSLGLVPDRCPEAEHWDQRGRPVRPGMIRVRCPGTRNLFYRYRSRRSDRSLTRTDQISLTGPPGSPPIYPPWTQGGAEGGPKG